MKEIKIALLAGDGIGPEIVAQAVKAVDAVAARSWFAISFANRSALIEDARILTMLLPISIAEMRES